MVEVEFNVALAKGSEFGAELAEFCGVLDLTGIMASMSERHCCCNS